MTKIELSTFINAPVEKCFDLARSIDVHMQSTEGTNEKAIAGRMGGLIEAGETVTWEATHFGIRQRLTTVIPEMRPPHYFMDEMVEGAFKSIYHEHFFESRAGGTVMKDIFRYEVPYGILGGIFNRLVLKRYMKSFLKKRNEAIKTIAESSH